MGSLSREVHEAGSGVEVRHFCGHVRRGVVRPEIIFSTSCLTNYAAHNKRLERTAHQLASSAKPFIERASENADIENGVELFDEAIHKLTGFHVDELSPIEHAKAVTVPTLVVQVHDDVLTKPSDVQTIYDNIAAKEKKLFWIEGTTRRFDGYNYLGEHPELMLEWFNMHMSDAQHQVAEAGAH